MLFVIVRQHELFEENYVTPMDVNHCGCGKLYAAWRIMDKYRGRYRRRKPDTQCSGCANNGFRTVTCS